MSIVVHGPISPSTYEMRPAATEGRAPVAARWRGAARLLACARNPEHVWMVARWAALGARHPLRAWAEKETALSRPSEATSPARSSPGSPIGETDPDRDEPGVATGPATSFLDPRFAHPASSFADEAPLSLRVAAAEACVARLDALEKEKEEGGFEKGFFAAGDSGGPGSGSAPGPGPSGGSTTASDASRPNEKEPFSALLRVSLARLAIVHAARVKYERVVSPEALRILDAAARDAEEQPSPKRAEAWSLAAVAKRWVATLGASPAAVAALPSRPHAVYDAGAAKVARANDLPPPASRESVARACLGGGCARRRA